MMATTVAAALAAAAPPAGGRSSPLSVVRRQCHSRPQQTGRGALQVRAAAASGSISVRSDGKKNVVSFDLIGSGKTTEQELKAADGTELIALAIPRPMGIIFEERKLSPVSAETSSACEAVEVVPGSNADKAGVKVGDVLRLTTAVLQVSDKVDIISFYGNPPKKSVRRAIFSADGQPFQKAMKAILSNSEPVELPGGDKMAFDSVLVVLERKKAA